MIGSFLLFLNCDDDSPPLYSCHRPSPHVLGHALNPGTWHLWKWKCALEAGSVLEISYYGQTSAVSGGPAVTVSTDRCREDGPTTAVPGSAVRTAGCCSNKCPHLDHLTNQRFGHFDPFYPFPYGSEYRSSINAGNRKNICYLLVGVSDPTL